MSNNHIDQFNLFGPKGCTCKGRQENDPHLPGCPLWQPPRPKIVDPKGAREEAKDGIRRSRYLTTQEMRDLYYAAACRALLKYPIPTPGRYPRPTVDQFWEELGQVGDGARDDGSAMGWVIQKLQDDGRMTAALGSDGNPRTRPSQRRETHGRSVYIWQAGEWAQRKTA